MIGDGDGDILQASGVPDTACPAGRSRGERRCGRMGVAIEARLCLRGRPGGRLSGRVTDVCLDGLCMRLDQAPPEGGAVLVELCLATPGECHVLPGRLSWVRPEGTGWRAGIALPDETAWAWFEALKRMASASGAATR